MTKEPTRWTPPAYVRSLAIGIVRRAESLLLFEGQDFSKDETFYRPLGGGIEFGERGSGAVQREFWEEVRVQVQVGKLLGALENIYVYEGKLGHEIVLVYETDLVDAALYDREDFECEGESGLTFHARWKPIDNFRSGRERLYPDGLLELLASDAR